MEGHRQGGRGVSQCICCRDGGPGWAWEAGTGLSYGTVLLKARPMTQSWIALCSEGWAGAVSLGLIWLEAGGEEGIWFYSVS